ncbi:PEP/pyruvate-binding domain-containing protein [Streptomyces sp. NPDC090112]|uniref:PEP/pyruvate-binding domain-containing protein n=1 Tax=Streptomyces sp. NPDC090112 TaxID=3365949 RepID=UPI0038233FD0
MALYVYDFAEGGRNSAELLGAKGASLAEMTRMGLPVPPGFTVTTEACRVLRATGDLPEELAGQMAEHLSTLEAAEGRRLGQVDDPLLLSVRSGAEFPPPGAAETVLDIGLNDLSVLGLAKEQGWGRERFAWDSYRRLVQMLGSTVLGVPPSLFEDVLQQVRDQHRVADDSGLDTCDLIRVVEMFKDLVLERSGSEFPQAPAEQLRQSILAAVTPRSAAWSRPDRSREDHAAGPDTAVTVQRMVFGNRGADSGSGVAHLSGSATGGCGLDGVYLPNAQGEEVLSGSRDALPLQQLAVLDPASYHRLCECAEHLADRYSDLCAIEFTIEKGVLWLLEARRQGLGG